MKKFVALVFVAVVCLAAWQILLRNFVFQPQIYAFEVDRRLNNYTVGASCWSRPVKVRGDTVYSTSGANVDRLVEFFSKEAGLFAWGITVPLQEYFDENDIIEYWFAEYDDEGNILWSDDFPDFSMDVIPERRLVRIDDDSFLILGFQKGASGENVVAMEVGLEYDGEHRGRIVPRWEKVVIEMGPGIFREVKRVEDGGYLFVVSKTILSIDAPMEDFDILIKTDSEGNVEWENVEIDYGFGMFVPQIYENPGKGYSIIAVAPKDGWTISIGKKYKNKKKKKLVMGAPWITEIDYEGHIDAVYQTPINWPYWGFHMLLDGDGGIFAAGVEKRKGAGENTHDIVVSKFSPSGDLLWEHFLGGKSLEYTMKVEKTKDDGNFIIAKTSSFGACYEWRNNSCSEYSETGDPNDVKNLLLIKLDSDGGIEWEKSFGSIFYETVPDILETADGDIFLGVHTQFSREQKGSISSIVKISGDGECEGVFPAGSGGWGFQLKEAENYQ